MRLFIAIDLPPHIKEYLKRLQVSLPQAKMSKTHNFHLTLKFLGSCDGNMRKKIEEALAHIHFQKFEASLESIGTFGGRHPRVIWVKMKVPAWLADTVREIEEAMARLGFKKEKRFVPHITLARMKFISVPKNFSEELKKKSVEPMKFSVSHFYLFESRLSPKGAVHTKLATFP